jgi:hypothetical protein
MEVGHPTASGTRSVNIIYGKISNLMPEVSGETAPKLPSAPAPRHPLFCAELPRCSPVCVRRKGPGFFHGREDPAAPCLNIVTMSILYSLRGISGYSGGERATHTSQYLALPVWEPVFWR